MSAQGQAEQDFQVEYQKAMERIQTMPDGAVGWVLRFLQTDLEALTPTEWTLVAFEVAAFVDETGERYGGMVAPESGWSVEGVPTREELSDDTQSQRSPGHSGYRPGAVGALLA